MGELITELIKRFGIWILLVLILVGALIWYITHLNAEPAERVSVFWGMIEYKKGKSQTVPEPVSEPRRGQKEVQEARQEPEPRQEVGSEIAGGIMSPDLGSRVERWFRVEGTITGEYRHLWLIERIGELHWPKEPELTPRDGHWVGGVNEGGWPLGGRFEILLVDVSEDVNQRFIEWLENGHRNGHYPGLHFDDLGDANILDSKDYLLITE